MIVISLGIKCSLQKKKTMKSFYQTFILQAESATHSVDSDAKYAFSMQKDKKETNY